MMGSAALLLIAITTLKRRGAVGELLGRTRAVAGSNPGNPIVSDGDPYGDPTRSSDHRVQHMGVLMAPRDLSGSDALASALNLDLEPPAKLPSGLLTLDNEGPVDSLALQRLARVQEDDASDHGGGSSASDEAGQLAGSVVSQFIPGATGDVSSAIIKKLTENLEKRRAKQLAEHGITYDFHTARYRDPLGLPCDPLRRPILCQLDDDEEIFTTLPPTRRQIKQQRERDARLQHLEEEARQIVAAKQSYDPFENGPRLAQEEADLVYQTRDLRTGTSKGTNQDASFIREDTVPLGNRASWNTEGGDIAAPVHRFSYPHQHSSDERQYEGDHGGHRNLTAIPNIESPVGIAHGGRGTGKEGRGQIGGPIGGLGSRRRRADNDNIDGARNSDGSGPLEPSGALGVEQAEGFGVVSSQRGQHRTGSNAKLKTERGLGGGASLLKFRQGRTAKNAEETAPFTAGF